MPFTFAMEPATAIALLATSWLVWPVNFDGSSSAFARNIPTIATLAFWVLVAIAAGMNNQLVVRSATSAQRTFLHPMLVNFDAPSRDECTADRTQSNSPQQALTLLNDEMYLEIARGVAEQAQRDLGKDATPRQIASQIFRRLLVRSPDRKELDAIVEFYKSQTDHSDPWMLVARAVMNTDEAITVP